MSSTTRVIVKVFNKSPETKEIKQEVMDEDPVMDTDESGMETGEIDNVEETPKDDPAENENPEINEEEFDEEEIDEEIDEEEETDLDIVYSSKEEPIVAIDLGTSNSVMAIFDRKEHKPDVVELTNSYVFPSAVFYSSSKSFVGGKKALEKAITEEDKQFLVTGSKRVIGLRQTCIGRDKGMKLEQVLNAEQLSVDWKMDKNGQVYYFIPTENGGYFKKSAVDVASDILTLMRREAESSLRMNIKKVVVTVPANFADSQRVATVQAAKKAGFETVRLVNEPTAVGIYHAFKNYIPSARIKISNKENKPQENAEENILIFDFGAGTLDITIAKVNIKQGSVYCIASEGDSFLGGNDIDNALFEYLEPKIKNFSYDPAALRKQCVLAKETLSTQPKCDFQLHEKTGKRKKKIIVKRSELKEATVDIQTRVKDLILNTLKAASNTSHNITANGIDKVILVGGSSRCFWIAEIIEGIFGSEKIVGGYNSFSVVAQGAAVYAACKLFKMETDFIAHEVTQKTLRMLFTVGRGKKQREELQVLIPKHSELAITKNQNLFPSEQRGKIIEIRLYEGDSVHPEECSLVCNFDLIGIEIRDEQQFYMSCTYTEEQMIRLKINELATGKVAEVEFDRLTQDPIKATIIDFSKMAAAPVPAQIKVSKTLNPKAVKVANEKK